MDDEIDRDIREHGWLCLNINDANPPFVYTAGLQESYQHPELILFGLSPAAGHQVLSAIVRTIRSGQKFAAGDVTREVLQNDVPLAFRIVDPTQHQVYLGYAMGRYRKTGVELAALQVYWPDKQGRFPFDVGCDFATFRAQPRLDIPLTPDEIAEFEREYGPG